jgi:hypothetical protein
VSDPAWRERIPVFDLFARHTDAFIRAVLTAVSLLDVAVVAKVENRTTPKISQKLIVSRLHHCNTPLRS